MTKNYDHHWNKGYEKSGDRIEIKTEAQKRRAARKRKRRKRSVGPRPLPMSTIVYKIEPKGG